MHRILLPIAILLACDLKAQTASEIASSSFVDTVIVYDTVVVEFFQLKYDTVTFYDTIRVELPPEQEPMVSDSAIQFYALNWEAAREMAKQRSAPFFIYFKAVWCGPCKVMEKMVFNNPEVKAYSEQNYIPVMMDVDDFDGLETASKFSVDLLPEVLFFDPEANLMGRYRGVISAESFLELLMSYR